MPVRRGDPARMLAAVNAAASGARPSRVVGEADRGGARRGLRRRRGRPRSTPGARRSPKPCAAPSGTCSACSPSAPPVARWRCASRRTRRSSAWPAPGTPAAPRRTWSRPTRSPGSGWRPGGPRGRSAVARRRGQRQRPARRPLRVPAAGRRANKPLSRHRASQPGRGERLTSAVLPVDCRGDQA